MDGLTRRELEFVPLRVKRSISRALEDKDESIRAYVVGGRNVLKSWVSDEYFHDTSRINDFNMLLLTLKKAEGRIFYVITYSVSSCLKRLFILLASIM